MPVIRVDDEVFRALQKQAIPFVDTPNSVLRRLLALDKLAPANQQRTGVRRVSGRSQEGSPREIYRRPILRALVALGGRAPTREVLQRAHQSLKGNLAPADLEELPSGQRLRWQENAEWERYHMVKEGLLVRGSPRGIWEITDEGRSLLLQPGSS
jgi:restriction system protein